MEFLCTDTESYSISLVNPWCTADTKSYSSLFSKSLTDDLSSEQQVQLQEYEKRKDFVFFLMFYLNTHRNSPFAPELAEKLKLIAPENFNNMDLDDKLMFADSLFPLIISYVDDHLIGCELQRYNPIGCLAYLLIDLVVHFKNDRIVYHFRQLLIKGAFYEVIIELLFVVNRVDILYMLVEVLEEAFEQQTFFKNPYVAYSFESLDKVTNLLQRYPNLLGRWQELAIKAGSEVCPPSFTLEEVDYANSFVRCSALGFLVYMNFLSPDAFQRLYAHFEMFSESIGDHLRSVYLCVFSIKNAWSVGSTNQLIFLIRNLFFPNAAWSQNQELAFQDCETEFSQDLFSRKVREVRKLTNIHSDDYIYYLASKSIVLWCTMRSELRVPVIAMINEMLTNEENGCQKYAALRVFGALVPLFATENQDFESNIIEIVDARIIPLIEDCSAPYYCKFRALSVLARVFQNYTLSYQQMSRYYEAIINCIYEKSNNVPRKLFCCIAMYELLSRNIVMAEKCCEETPFDLTYFSVLRYDDISPLRICAIYFLVKCEWDECQTREMLCGLIDYCHGFADLEQFYENAYLQGVVRSCIERIRVVLLLRRAMNQDFIAELIPLFFWIFRNRILSCYGVIFNVMETALIAIERIDNLEFIKFFDAIVDQDHSAFETLTEQFGIVLKMFAKKTTLPNQSLEKLISFCIRTLSQKEVLPEWLAGCVLAIHFQFSKLQSSDIANLETLFNTLLSNFNRMSSLCYTQALLVLMQLIRLRSELFQRVPLQFWEETCEIRDPLYCKCVVDALAPRIRNMSNPKVLEIFCQSLVISSSVNEISSEGIESVDELEEERESYIRGIVPIDLTSQVSENDEPSYGTVEMDTTELDIAVCA